MTDRLEASNLATLGKRWARHCHFPAKGRILVDLVGHINLSRPRLLRGPLSDVQLLLNIDGSALFTQRATFAVGLTCLRAKGPVSQAPIRRVLRT